MMQAYWVHLVEILRPSVIIGFMITVITLVLMKELYSSRMYWSEILNRSLEEPEAASRIVYLMHGIVTSIGILVSVIGFFFTTIDRTAVVELILALGGSNGVASLGRYYTKKAGTIADQSEPLIVRPEPNPVNVNVTPSNLPPPQATPFPQPESLPVGRP